MTSRRGILFSLVGPSGSGKSTLAKKLLEKYKGTISLSVSYTSRAPREREVEGEHYHFVSRDEFEKMRDRGEFFEWEENHGNYYGTLLKTLDGAIQQGIDLLLDVDIRGALTFKKKFPEDAVSVFLLPPSLEELKTRLRQRGAMSEEEFQRRLQTAETEYARFLESCNPSNKEHVDYFLVNDVREDAFQLLEEIYRSETHRVSRYPVNTLKPYCTIS